MGSEEFAKVVRGVVLREKPLRTVALKAGVSRGLLYDMLGGHVPTFKTLVSVAEALELPDADRHRLLVAAGYGEGLALGSSLMEPGRWVDVVRRMEQLTPERERAVRRLLDEPTYLDAVAALIGARDRPEPAPAWQ